MEQDQPGPGRARREDGNERNGVTEPGADAPAAAPVAGSSDAQSSNTASKSYMEGCQVRVLLIGVDSLYLSYYGEIDPHVDFELSGKKLQAQSRDPREKALAQWEVQGHIFEVSDRGQRGVGHGGFAYVLEDKAFRIALSSSGSRALPLGYVKVSSEYLAHVGPVAAVDELNAIMATFGSAEDVPTVSRVDLFVDFQSDVDMEGWPRAAWVTRAGSINTYSVRGEFSGYTVGQGGPISCRLYNKSLEILKSRKTYFVELWKRSGIDPNRRVWRLEIQAVREVLHQLGIRSFQGLMRELGGIWAYATQTWLRLAVPQAGDSNCARWPTHPLWQRLAGIQWSTADSSLTRTFSPARIPAADRLFRMYLALLTSFIASNRLKDIPSRWEFAEGQAEFIKQAQAFHESRCTKYLSISLEDYVAQEVALKARQYNTLRNVRTVKQDAESSDEVDRDATDYYRASRGE